MSYPCLHLFIYNIVLGCVVLKKIYCERAKRGDNLCKLEDKLSVIKRQKKTENLVAITRLLRMSRTTVFTIVHKKDKILAHIKRYIQVEKRQNLWSNVVFFLFGLLVWNVTLLLLVKDSLKRKPCFCLMTSRKNIQMRKLERSRHVKDDSRDLNIEDDVITSLRKKMKVLTKKHKQNVITH